MKPGLICLVRRHQRYSSWDSDDIAALAGLLRRLNDTAR